MKFKHAIPLVALLPLLLSSVVFAAAPRAVSNATGTVVLTYEAGHSLNSLKLAWVSAASGEVNAVLSPFYGELYRVCFDPGAASPTAAYDVVLNDVDGVDVLQGLGANLSATATTSKATTIDGPGTNDHLPVAIAGKLTLAITNAGNTKQGIIRLYWRD